MSVAAARWATPIVGIPMTAKLVLLVLADHADDDGRCWPAVPRLAKLCCMSERATQGAIKVLAAAGLVTLSGENGGRRIFMLAITTPAASAPPTPAGGAPPPHVLRGLDVATPAGDAPTPAAAAPTPAASAPEPTIEPTIEPKLPPVASRARGLAAGSRLPEDWQPDAACRAYAIERNLDPDKLLEDFRGYWHSADAKSPMRKDWPGTWQRRCRDVAGRPAFALSHGGVSTRSAQRVGGGARQSREDILRAAGLWPQIEHPMPALPLITNGGDRDE